MTLSAAPLVYLLIFAAIPTLVGAIYLAVFGKSINLNNRVSRRLALLEKSNNNREQVLEQLRKEMSQHMNSRGIPLYSMLATK
ncbi:MAG: pilus assembly protein TadB, partial [Cypionkella sp.]